MLIPWLVLPLLIYGKDIAIESYDFEDDHENLKTLGGRLETGFNVGVSSFGNASYNHKTAGFVDYNSDLSSGMNAGAYVAYNFTNRFNVRVQYKYSSTKSSALYVMPTKSTANDLIYMEDHYMFHQLGTAVYYRLNLYQGKLFLAPGVGVSSVSFKNNAQLVVSYSQQSYSTSFDSYLSLEYFISNHIGMGVTSYASSQVTFNEAKVKLAEEAVLGVAPDNKFNFSDVSFRFMYLF